MVAKYRIRLYLITLFVLVGFGALVQRLWDLTIERHDEFAAKIKGAKTLRARIPGARGEIKDRNGVTLVANKPSFEVRINLKMLVDEYKRQIEEDNKRMSEENKKIAEENKHIADPDKRKPKFAKRTIPTVEYEYMDHGIKRSKMELDIVSIVDEAVQEPLSRIGLAADFKAEQLRIQYRTNRGVVPWIYRQDLTFEDFSQFAEHSLGLPGVNVSVRPVRQYLYDAFACHVLGYVNQADEKLVPEEEKKGWDFFVPDDYGKTGVERSFDSELRGRPGFQEMLEDERGHIVEMLSRQEPARGNDVWLTIDARIQYIVERAMRESIPKLGRAAVVVLQPSTGEVLAMASVPSFNPNKFIPYITSADWDVYLKNAVNPLMNRAVQAYAPGSTYKAMVSFSGILAGNERDRFNCPGGITYGNKYMKCWIGAQGGAHGTLDLMGGLKNSCNSFFYQYGNHAGIANIEKAGKMFGMGEKSGIELSDEVGGILPTPRWLQRTRHESWPKGNNAQTANVSIGQGYVLATPLQMAGVAAAVGDGTAAYKQHLLKKVVDHGDVVRDIMPVARTKFSDMGITPDKVELVRRGMWKVVNEEGGTARGARLEGGVELAGKTGTAEAWRPDGVKDNHTLFICFAPYKNPKYAICTFLEGGKSGGGCAAPIAKRIMEQALSLDKGYSVTLAPVKEVAGNLNHIDSVTFEGVAPVALKPDEVDNDTGADADIPEPPKAKAIPVARPAAPTIRAEPDAEGSRIKNQAQPPRRGSLFQPPSPPVPGLRR